MSIKKISVVTICILSLVLTLCGCESKDNTTSTTNTTVKEPKIEYTIGVCQGGQSTYYDQILAGFTTAVNDNFQEEKAAINTVIADEGIPTDAICQGFSQNNVSLIFTIGENSLVSAHNATTTIPIVGTAVMDYQKALNLPTDKDWDKKTGQNITGISSVPNMADILSMMIEVTPNINSVGILYCPEDKDSEYQNHILEKYLDQAGIKWKEYELYSPSMSNQAVREIVSYAAGESSALFIPAESKLIEKMGVIRNVALEKNIPTVAGDEYIGADTLCSMYDDPYDQGYKAGEMAYEILKSGKKPQNIAIASPSADAEQKLYEGEIAEKMNYKFTKSFKERNDFLSTYKIGSKTKRDNQQTK